MAWKQEAEEMGEESPFVTSLLTMTAGFATKRKAGEVRQGAMGTKSRLQPRLVFTMTNTSNNSPVPNKTEACQIFHAHTHE